MLKEGKRDLRDMAFMMKMTMGFRDDPLRHEKALLDDWLGEDFKRAKYTEPQTSLPTAASHPDSRPFLFFHAVTLLSSVPEADRSAARLDKWLWAMRVFKTRALATDACRAGSVAVNELVAKPAREVHAGEVVTVRQGLFTRTLRVVGVPVVTGRTELAAGVLCGFDAAGGIRAVARAQCAAGIGARKRERTADEEGAAVAG